MITTFELLLLITVLCLAVSTTVLAASVPFLYWKCFRLEDRLATQRVELLKQIDTLDETLARLLEGVGIPTSREG